MLEVIGARPGKHCPTVAGTAVPAIWEVTVEPAERVPACSRPPWWLFVCLSGLIFNYCYYFKHKHISPAYLLHHV